MKVRSLISPPPPIWRESRLALEVASLVRHPINRGEGIGDADGQPVLLIPGFLAGDDSLGLMTRWLRRTGHHTRKAGMRANIDCSEETIARLIDRLELLNETRGEKVAIIGQSRGGCIARVLAVRRPDLVSGIVTMGSPIVKPFAIHPAVHLHIFAVGALGTLGAPGFFRRSCRYGECCTSFWDDLAGPFPKGVGFLSIYSKSDGIVNWRSCLDPAAVHVEIESSHIGMAVNPRGYEALAKTLAAYREAGRVKKRRPAARKAAAARGTLRKAA